MTKLRRVTKKQATQAARGTTRRVIGYVRVSSDQQADSGLGLDDQRAKLEAYCAVKDLELVDVVVDAGESAKSLDRPGIQAALQRLACGEADALLVGKLDRLTRSLRDLATLLERHFSGAVALLCMEHDVDTASAAGRMVLNLLMTVAQWEREAISERTASALAVKAARGERTTRFAPYGWQHVGGRVVECAEEQSVLRRVRELHAQGVSVRKIGAQLAVDGYRSRAGDAFGATQVQRMLGRVVEVPAGE